jgi:hypothetical protein
MNPKTLVSIVVALLLALGIGFATAHFLTNSGSSDAPHTMPNGETMSGMMDTSP